MGFPGYIQINGITYVTSGDALVDRMMTVPQAVYLHPAMEVLQRFRAIVPDAALSVVCVRLSAVWSAAAWIAQES